MRAFLRSRDRLLAKLPSQVQTVQNENGIPAPAQQGASSSRGEAERAQPFRPKVQERSILVQVRKARAEGGARGVLVRRVLDNENWSDRTGRAGFHPGPEDQKPSKLTATTIPAGAAEQNFMAGDFKAFGR